MSMSEAATAPAATGTGVRIQVRPLAGGGKLVHDYLSGHDLSPFYSGHHSDPSAYERKAAEVDTRLSAAARAVAGAAVEPLGDSGDRLRRILAGDGFFVTTGQQPALFGGPLYTLYKILGAIRLAEVLERQLGKPVLALFWTGSDDHDWAEANHSVVLDTQKYPHRITVAAPEDAPPLPLSHRRWGAGVSAAVAEFVGMLPDTVGADEIAEHVRSVYVPGATVAESFTETVRYLLADRRLAIVDSAHPAVRRAAAPVLRHDLERVLRGNDPVDRQTKRLEAAGYTAQVAVASDASNVMLIDGEGRDRIIRTARGWATRRERSGIPERALLDMVESEPDRFSPNVLLRPVVESAIFPTIAYVAGPGELSYFAQLGCLFESHGIVPPVVVPRPSVTLLDTRAAPALDRLGMEAEALSRPFRDVVADAIAAEMPATVRDALASARSAITAEFEQLAGAAASIDPTLRGPLIGSRNASLLEVLAAEKKITTQLRRANRTKIEQLRRAAALVFPFDKPQERVFGPLPYVAVYGRELVAEIEAALDMELREVASWRGSDSA